MEAIYVYPICECNRNDNMLDSVVARSRTEAEERIIRKLVDEYEDIPYPADYEDLKSSLLDIDIILGDVVELDELIN